MKKPLIIIINGAGGVGKDTICDIVGKYYKTKVVFPNTIIACRNSVGLL